LLVAHQLVFDPEPDPEFVVAVHEFEILVEGSAAAESEAEAVGSTYSDSSVEQH
jgi:hypothetical protein